MLALESDSAAQPDHNNQRDYATLKRRIQEAGLLQKRPAYYVLSITTNTAVMVFCLVVLFTVGVVWAQALAAVGLAIVSGQLGFQLHDSGHRQMFVSGRKNAIVGLVTADLLLGMSYGWWVQKHNRHHGNPNDVDLDPDIKVGAIAYTDEQARARRGAGRLAAMYQAYLFFPLTTFLAWSMHVTGLSYLIKESSRYRRLEFGLLAVHAVVYLTAMVYFLGPWSALMVVLIHKGIGGAYMASVFAPNHKGMPQTDSATRMDFVRLAQLPDRAPPVPWHAPAQHAAGAADHQAVLPGAGNRVLRDVVPRFIPRAARIPERDRRSASGRGNSGIGTFSSH